MPRVSRWGAPLRLVPLVLPLGLAMAGCNEVTTPTVTPPTLPEVGLPTPTTIVVPPTTAVQPTSTVRPVPAPATTTSTTAVGSDAVQAGSPGGDEGESRDDWELFWTGGGDGLGFDGFFAGFSSTLAAVVAGVAYAAGSMAVALATLALLPSGSLVLWPSTRASAVLGTLFGGFVGAIGVLLAGLLVAAYALWRRGSASHGGSSPLGH